MQVFTGGDCIDLIQHGPQMGFLLLTASCKSGLNLLLALDPSRYTLRYRVCPINLVNTNNDAKCLGTEIGVLWSVITINTTADCNWTFAGVPDAVYTYPTTSAKINYPTRDGKQTSFTNYLFTNNYYPKSNGIFGMSSMYGATTYYPSTFQGFTYVLNATGLPPFWQGPFGPSTNLPANYTFNLRGTSQFEVISPVDQCTYTYQITSGSFAGMKTAACNSSQSGCTASCTAGRYKQPLQGVSGSSNYVCAFCPAGSYSKDGSSCQKCSGNAAAAQAGATTCKECPMPLVASNTATACTGCNFNGYSSLLATQGNTQNSIFTGANSCSNKTCPPWSLATLNNECISAYGAKLCVASPGSSTCSGNGFKGVKPTTKGGAVLQLLAASVQDPVCSNGPRPLASWLRGKSTWAGYNMSSRNYYPTPDDGSVQGFQWQVMGVNPVAEPASAIGRYPICGNAHGGPGPLPYLTQYGEPLDTTAVMWRSILNYTGWDVVMTKGSAAGTLDTTWFRDSSFGGCGLTSLNAQVPSGVCKMTFRVIAGSFLGVSTTAKTCPSGTSAISQPGGTVSCFACGPGYTVAAKSATMDKETGSGGCSACAGSNWQDIWGSTSCKGNCKQTYPNVTMTWGNTFCYSPSSGS
eukprot:jgi/Chrzof1/11692/Cz06g05180.t1